MAAAAAASGGGAGGGATVHVTVTGFAQCHYFKRARAALAGLAVLEPSVEVEVIEHPDRDTYRSWWPEHRGVFGPRAAEHMSSPAVWLNGTQFLGGCDATLAWIRTNYMAGAGVAHRPRVEHANDVVAAGEPAYDYDLVVIGGGSGGLACAKAAAGFGAKVAVLDFVKPSPAGSTWGLGGTCVNVGCIPKKLMHTAALLGESLTDAAAFGWDVPAGRTHSWERMVSAVQDHISSLNFGYRVALREKGVTYLNALGSFVDPHTLNTVDKKGKAKAITGRRIVIAVGGRPKPLEVPGGELAISSDDLFSLPHAPGKTLVVGASYVALECAGFLAGLGYDATVMVRSILLRGFDQQMAEAIGDHMAAHGVKFVRPALPTKVEKTADGRLAVTWTATDTGAVATDVYDTVLVATGRGADTAGLGLDKAGVTVERDGKLAAVGEQTNVPHIYALGDVLSGRLELTPVAIAAGKLLAARLFNGATEGMDYERVPTTVFTPLEYGACGLSEDDAVARYGADGVEVYHASFTPLEWTVVEARPKNKCYVKLVVHKGDSNRVVGFHILGPHAGEVTQGWGATLRLGATYESFSATVGIHPTVAEELTTLTITKSSGEGADKTGC